MVGFLACCSMLGPRQPALRCELSRSAPSHALPRLSHSRTSLIQLRPRSQSFQLPRKRASSSLRPLTRHRTASSTLPLLHRFISQPRLDFAIAAHKRVDDAPLLLDGLGFVTVEHGRGRSAAGMYGEEGRTTSGLERFLASELAHSLLDLVRARANELLVCERAHGMSQDRLRRFFHKLFRRLDTAARQTRLSLSLFTGLTALALHNTSQLLRRLIVSSLIHQSSAGTCST